MAIKLKKNEISGPDASEALLDHIKMLLQLRMSHDMSGMEGEDRMRGEEGEEGEDGEMDDGEMEASERDGGREGEEEAMKEMKKGPHQEYGSAAYWNERYTKYAFIKRLH